MGSHCSFLLIIGHFRAGYPEVETLVQPVSPGQLSLLDLSPQPAPEVLSVAGAVSASRSDATLRACSAQWRQFVAWAGDAGVPWLPAAPVGVAEYLTTLVGRGAGLATVRTSPPSPRWSV